MFGMDLLCQSLHPHEDVLQKLSQSQSADFARNFFRFDKYDQSSCCCFYYLHRGHWSSKETPRSAGGGEGKGTQITGLASSFDWMDALNLGKKEGDWGLPTYSFSSFWKTTRGLLSAHSERASKSKLYLGKQWHAKLNSLWGINISEGT